MNESASDADNNVPNKLKSLRDIESLAELKFDEILSGETPEGIEEKCLKLCKNYLSGNWCHQTLQTVTINRITGGTANQIYHCAINEPDLTTQEVPQEVVIRFYGSHTFIENDNNMRDIIISLIFSENKIGPKIYGVFEGGLIQKYYQHRRFKKEEQSKTGLVEKLFKTLARIHSLDIPIKKYPAYYDNKLCEWYDVAHHKFNIKNEINEYKCQTLNSTDLKAEINWMNNVIEKKNCAIVFTHRDFRANNIMITEPNNELIICDFDLSSYSYRGLDFDAISDEFCRQSFELKVLDEFPLRDSVILPLIKIYVEECERIHGKSYSENPINSVENILCETKIMFLFSLLFGAILMIRNDGTAGDFPMSRKLALETAEICIQNYLFVKTVLLEEKVIDNCF